jgi:hypothetical protein
MPSAGLEVISQEHHTGLKPVKHTAIYLDKELKFYDKGTSSRVD